jgi:hypothetical protein
VKLEISSRPCSSRPGAHGRDVNKTRQDFATPWEHLDPSANLPRFLAAGIHLARATDRGILTWRDAP